MVSLPIEKPVKQRNWRLPAAANFIIGGSGAGLYLFSCIQTLMMFGSVFVSKPLPFGLIPPILIGFGFLFLGFEAGRPLRGCYLFGHLHQSWISREAFAGFIFIPSAIWDYFFPYPALRVLAIMSALGYLISQGFIVYRARAIAAWNMPIIPVVFVSAGLVSGYGLFIILTAPETTGSNETILLFGLIFLIFNLSIWLVYLWQLSSTDLFSVTMTLRQPFSLTLTIGFGHIIPLVLLLFLIVQKNTIAPIYLSTMIVLCGLLLIIGNISQKTCIMLSTGYFRIIAFRY
jgi:DMSO reductase anchor subunit